MFRLLYSVLIKYVQKTTVREMEIQFHRQSSRFHNPFEKEVHVDNNMIIKVPHDNIKKDTNHPASKGRIEYVEDE